MICKKNSIWTLITITDPNGLPGKSIFDVILILRRFIEFKFVIIDDIIGATASILLDKENTIMKTEDLLKIICDVTQFDWGDFFLFKKYPKNWINSKKIKYHDVISQTDTTIRAIDDGYIYIYTPFQEIVDVIKNNYEIESIKTGSLENLDYPD